MSRVPICQGQWIHARSRICDSKNPSTFLIFLLYWEPACEIQWLWHFYGLGVINIVKASETRGNSR
jgi:hypothetical protein